MTKTEKRKPARVLLVEKDDGVARICQKALTTERLTVERVSCPREALERLERYRPQAILLGDDLEGYLSFELCEELRARTQVPLIVLTTSDSPGFIVNCLQSGADDVLVRPIEPTVLQAKLQAHLRRAFRYSVVPVAAATKTTDKPKVPAAAPAPAPVEAAAPAPAPLLMPEVTEQLTEAPPPDFKKWPNCLSCNFMGPRDRFIMKDDEGKLRRACPSCGEKRMLSFP